MLLAFVLFLLDIKAPTHGALTAAGVGSMIVGGLVFFNSPSVPSFQRVSVPLVFGSSLMTGALFFIILLIALRAQKIPVLTGINRLIGQEGVARSDLAPAGQVYVGGEQWSAELINRQENLPKGAHVRVVAIQGLKVIVQKSE